MVAAPLPATLGDALDGGVAASELASERRTVALYGRNGVGKTTLACQGPGPIALIAIDPAPTGGARSVDRADVVVYRVAASPLPRKDGTPEPWHGSEKVLAVVEAIRARSVAAGKCPFAKVVIDGLNSWFDVILGEVLGLDWKSMPAILKKNKVSTDEYVERSERLIRYLRPITQLPCDVWLLAQEKDHNPPKDNKGIVIGSKLIREQKAAQEGSFFSLAISDEAARQVQNACDFVLQLYDDDETRAEKMPDVVVNGDVIPGPTQLVPTGRRVRRLRCVYHANYAARFRSPVYKNIPQYIEAPSPEERYQAVMDAAAGRRSKWGVYEHPE